MSTLPPSEADTAKSNYSNVVDVLLLDESDDGGGPASESFPQAQINKKRLKKRSRFFTILAIRCLNIVKSK